MYGLSNTKKKILYQHHILKVIFLHGLGDTGTGWMRQFQQYALPNVKYIFPSASARPVTLNGGTSMPAWFDIKTLDPRGTQDEAGIMKASEKLKHLIAEEEKLVPTNRIIIGGFSQGGSLALYTSLTDSRKLGGVLAFSCWLPPHAQQICHPDGCKNLVYHCHGTADMMLPYSLGQMTAALLKQFNPDHQLITLNGVGHAGSEEELSGAKAFIQKQLVNPD